MNFRISNAGALYWFALSMIALSLCVSVVVLIFLAAYKNGTPGIVLGIVGFSVFLKIMLEGIAKGLCRLVVSTFCLISSSKGMGLSVSDSSIVYLDIFSIKIENISSAEKGYISEGKFLEAYVFLNVKNKEEVFFHRNRVLNFFYLLELTKTQQNRINNKYFLRLDPQLLVGDVDQIIDLINKEIKLQEGK